MGRFPTTKFRMWTGQPINAPEVTPPLALRTLVVLSVVSVTATLIFGVTQQLAVGGTPELSILDIISIVGFYFILPVLVALTILTNRSVSRLLILAYGCFIFFQAASHVNSTKLSIQETTVFLVLIVLCFLGLLWWLYRSARMRMYFALIDGLPIPEDLKESADLLVAPSKIEVRFSSMARTVAPYFEWATGILIIVFVILAIAQMT